MASSYRYGFDGNKDRVDLDAFALEIKQSIYPVGSFYMTTDSRNPSRILGFGTWKQIGGGRTLINAGLYKDGTTGDAGVTVPVRSMGGNWYTKLNVNHLPPHYHDMTHDHRVECKQLGNSKTDDGQTIDPSLNTALNYDRQIYTDISDSAGGGINNFVMHAINKWWSSSGIQNGLLYRLLKANTGEVANPIVAAEYKSYTSNAYNGRSKEETTQSAMASSFSNMSPYYACYIWERQA